MPGEFQSREDLRLTPEQQTEVMRLAARFQSEDAEKLSPQQLAEIASEAGIEERYVQRAIEQVQEASLRKSVAPPPLEAVTPDLANSRTVSFIFLVVQMWAAFVVVDADLLSAGIKGQPLYVTAFLALMMGWFSTPDRRGRRRGVAKILGAGMFGLLIAGLFHFAFVGFPLNPHWLSWAGVGLLVQAVAFRVGRILRRPGSEGLLHS